MKIEKVSFLNTEGQQLSGRLELPVNQQPHNFAIFAHCFTCNKNLSAVKNISRALTSNGFGVLRFDFTGLGESDGDFSDTNFSGNVGDLVSAANHLAKNYEAPTLLVGHSLGGAAAIFAASQIDSIKAIATVGAPSNPKHVQHLLHGSLEEIQANGFTTQIKAGNNYMVTDEPISYGGNDFGPSPYEFVSAGLSACTAMTIQMYAKRKGWQIENIEVHTSYGKVHAKDCNLCDENSAKIDTFNREIKFENDLDENQLTRLLQIADKCPVHKTLNSDTQIITNLLK